MAVIADPGGIWIQLASVFFLGAALFNDILLIRICLVGGFVFLVANAFTGFPTAEQGFINRTDDGDWLVGVDAIVWGIVTGAFHVWAVFRFLRDERKITFDGDTEQLYRFFYRRSGMTPLECLQTFQRAQWASFEAGELICTSFNGATPPIFSLIVEGLVDIKSEVDGKQHVHPITLRSGDFFDLSAANVFGVRLGFFSDTFEARARTRCLVVQWTVSDLYELAYRASPAVSSYWRNMMLYAIAAELNRSHAARQRNAVDSHGEPEDEGWLLGERSRDFTAELRPDEQPEQGGMRSTLRWLWKSLSPFPPPGVRHNALPTTGVLASNRTMAFVRSRTHAFRKRLSVAVRQSAPGSMDDLRLPELNGGNVAIAVL